MNLVERFAEARKQYGEHFEVHYLFDSTGVEVRMFTNSLSKFVPRFHVTAWVSAFHWDRKSPPTYTWDEAVEQATLDAFDKAAKAAKA